MVPNSVNIAVEIAAILLTIVIVARALPLIREGSRPMTTALFIFSVVSFMLSLAYWLTYSLIRPEGRMPFAANEIGEIAWFLLLASTLESIFRDSYIPSKKEIAFAILFTAASVALWIGWSGEWAQDIIVGFAFGYFLCTCVRALKQSGAFERNGWILLGVSCGSIILAQTGTFHVPEAIKRPLDHVCYVLMFAVLIGLFVKAVRLAKENVGTEKVAHEGASRDTKSTLAMSFSVCAFGFSTLYMSSGWFYIAALVLCLATLPLMLIALRREVSP